MRETGGRRPRARGWAGAGLLLAVSAGAAEDRAVLFELRREPFAPAERLAGEELDAGQRVPLADGAWLGEIVLPRDWKDSRGQGIAAGRYALRYALQPRRKDHVGVDRVRDFALLIPASGARSGVLPAAGGEGGKRPDWVTLSSALTGTRHPAVMALAPAGTETASQARRPDPGLDGLDLEIRPVGDLRIGFAVGGGIEPTEAF